MKRLLLLSKVLSKVLTLAILLNVVWAEKANAQFSIPRGIASVIGVGPVAAPFAYQSYALSGSDSSIVTWTMDVTSAPASWTYAIEGSNDNTAWFSLDTSTSVADDGGDIGPTAARFVRLNITAVSGTGEFTLTVVAQRITVGAGGGAEEFVGGTLTEDLVFSTGVDLSLADNSEIEYGDTRLLRSAANSLTLDDGAGGAANLITTGYFRAASFRLTTNAAISGAASGVTRLNNAGFSKYLAFQSNGAPTCATNCGTSPTLAGVDSSFTLTMGATGVPASGFVITFSAAMAAAPQCIAQMALAGMVVGKTPLTIVTTTTTATVVTNGTAPATSDKYHFICALGQ